MFNNKKFYFKLTLISFLEISIYGDFVTSLTAYYSCVDINPTSFMINPILTPLVLGYPSPDLY